MRVEIVEDSEERIPSLAFPSGGKYRDLRENPAEIEKISGARRYLPLRNFLATVNGKDSIFATARATTKTGSPPSASSGYAHEFASEKILVFVDPAYNFDRLRYAELGAGLKELLERDPTDSVRAVIQLSPCTFPPQDRRGYCLNFRLVAIGDTTQQAEMRWGLALARVQQALMFRARALKQQADA
jgi:hypothetical protein